MRRRRPLRHLLGRSLAAGLLALCCGPARPLDLLDIAEAGVKGLLNPDCSRYCITGVCLWLQCDFLLCKVLPTFRVRHRWPDLLVSSWDQRGHPLREIQPLVDGWKRLREWSSGGGGDGSARRAASAHFLEADVLGSPLAAVDLPGFCEPSPQPFRPYYASLQDVDLWRGRGGLIQAYLGEENNDGDREFTAQGRSWGRLFPRTGFVDAPLDPQGAAALAAHRALDIVAGGQGAAAHQAAGRRAPGGRPQRRPRRGLLAAPGRGRGRGGWG